VSTDRDVDPGVLPTVAIAAAAASADTVDLGAGAGPAGYRAVARRHRRAGRRAQQRAAE